MFSIVCLRSFFLLNLWNWKVKELDERDGLPNNVEKQKHTHLFKQVYSDKQACIMHTYLFFYLLLLRQFLCLIHSYLCMHHTCMQTLSGKTNFISLVHLIICLLVPGPCWECQWIASGFRVVQSKLRNMHLTVCFNLSECRHFYCAWASLIKLHHVMHDLIKPGFNGLETVNSLLVSVTQEYFVWFQMIQSDHFLINLHRVKF